MKQELHRSENPILPSVPGKNSFRAPDNYFEYLPGEIMEKIHSRKEVPASFTLRPALSYISLAVLSAAVLLLVYFSMKKSESLPADVQLSENEIQHIIDNPSSYSIDDSSISDEFLSANMESVFVPDEDLEAGIETYLEENLNTYTITEF